MTHLYIHEMHGFPEAYICSYAMYEYLGGVIFGDYPLIPDRYCRKLHLYALDQQMLDCAYKDHYTLAILEGAS